MATHKCKTCGRTMTSGLKVTPTEGIPEIKKPLWFCSERCLNAFVGNVKAQRKKSMKKDMRAALENADREPTEEDYSDIISTLSAAEKNLLAAIGMGVTFATHRTIKEFYENLRQKLK
ncbi:MAG: hypothetical protein K5751_01895 [Treponemataceae bacterium]|nr:hypothetical protein [Treponemataceae bacterium]